MDSTLALCLLVAGLALVLLLCVRELKAGPSGAVPDAARGAIDPRDGSVLHGSAYAVDGDTVVIARTSIRLFGIDAPEIDHPWGRKAKWALVGLCKGQMVRATIVERDVYGRTVARCHLDDGRDLSAEMVKLGLAIDWPKFSGGEFRALETPDARTRLWLADARQRGRMDVWERFEARSRTGATRN